MDSTVIVVDGRLAGSNAYLMLCSFVVYDGLVAMICIHHGMGAFIESVNSMVDGVLNILAIRIIICPFLGHIQCFQFVRRPFYALRRVQRIYEMMLFIDTINN